MSFKAKLLAWGVAFLVVVSMVYGIVSKINDVFDTMKEQADEISRLNGENEKLSAQKSYLTLQVQELTKNKQEVDKINADLKDKERQRDVEFDALQDELRLARLKQKQQPHAEPSKDEPQATDTLEVDVAWRAYCKALPGGCPEGAIR